MGTLFQHEMATAIGAVDLVLFAQGQINARMAQGTIAAIAGDSRGLDFNHFGRFHDDVMSFNNHKIPIGSSAGATVPCQSGAGWHIDPLRGR